MLYRTSVPTRRSPPAPRAYSRAALAIGSGRGPASQRLVTLAAAALMAVTVAGGEAGGGRRCAPRRWFDVEAGCVGVRPVGGGGPVVRADAAEQQHENQHLA